MGSLPANLPARRDVVVLACGFADGEGGLCIPGCRAAVGGYDGESDFGGPHINDKAVVGGVVRAVGYGVDGNIAGDIKVEIESGRMRKIDEDFDLDAVGRGCGGILKGRRRIFKRNRVVVGGNVDGELVCIGINLPVIRGKTRRVRLDGDGVFFPKFGMFVSPGVYAE